MIEFLAANWVWIVLVGAVLAMHRGGGCGSHGHGSHSGGDQQHHDRQPTVDRGDHTTHR